MRRKAMSSPINHVVDNANVIKVQLSDGRKFDAKVGWGKIRVLISR
ncbi:Periplasmic serine endoprotease DegP precursor [Kluyvera cryocrescens]|uniref:Periplasmic serine endoprotease DegP n=1 Tax=Kluyvera cryocrescens TaxID=580 RepID=A0A485BFS7_KLUCR|nr:Periplasmic serine endoprotease DegP precursor [Kluyvera cryocrescens]